MHTYLFVDGLDMIARSHSGAVGLHPRQLLRPGGPLYPTDAIRDVNVASLVPSEPNTGGLIVRVRLRGETAVWTELMYPDLQGGLVDEVRFDLRQYLGEIERAYREWEAADGEASLTGDGCRNTRGPVE
ncbi:hypothetical protein [Streptomyces sp. NBC_00503]|uniref:hypothetical protein n=1 Tax=Streptomyces sp. NBC_00503 TaxID=2903659 RepID=UPI002E823DFB|nr:hypothetical protein [Streptomyces sp. NBC_00503]WUD85444.1 hypothetical protein OG490_35515 [Streptomyces sp. NBC_00503]